MGATSEVFSRPQHPYSRVLLTSLPSIDPDAVPNRTVLEGDPPTPINPPPGCPFEPRCPDARDLCRREKPELRVHGGEASHLSACPFPYL